MPIFKKSDKHWYARRLIKYKAFCREFIDFVRLFFGTNMERHAIFWCQMLSRAKNDSPSTDVPAVVKCAKNLWGHSKMDTSRISGLLGDVIGLLKAHDINDNLLHEQIRTVINSALVKADVVTRDEFEAQRAVLLRTRTKLEQLESLVADLEKQIKA